MWRRRRKADVSRERAVRDKVGDEASPEKDGIERFEAPDTSRTAEADSIGRTELDAGWRGAEVEGRI